MKWSSLEEEFGPASSLTIHNPIIVKKTTYDSKRIINNKRLM
jgi:hypothetical protein